ncbi:hypothetical protein FQ154_01600 [Paeniglutamicibacter gangotriensis]|uniref:Uncharacterized protein n=1 Tax=Paeniglutamicibacter gangotriensis TaxID=254787 RepID=A0A5B0EQ89_9MICC|nr:hypothetical protein [Paeniglutamicibacter gangotriensis]KAA0979880.1 hypothetical protein FQ154_01600 [Paeniglutamicibacter gangotriensis]
MTENQNTPTTELDFDEWLAGGERTTHHVTLFGRLDLLADIEELEKQRIPYEAPPEGDEALGGETDPNAELDAKIAVLEAQVYASKREFRVSAITGNEELDLLDQIRKDLAKEIEAAAAEGRREAKTTAKLMDITAPADINALARTGANEKTNEVVSRELRVRKIAMAAKTRIKGDWAPISRDQVERMLTILGDAQMGLIADAVIASSDDVPLVTVPKS